VHAYETAEARRRAQDQQQEFWQQQQQQRRRQQRQRQQQQQAGGEGGPFAAQDPREFFEQFMRDPLSFFEKFARQQQQQQQQQRFQQQQQQQQYRGRGGYGGSSGSSGGGSGGGMGGPPGDPRGYYTTLGVKRGASTQEVQAAFRGLALQHHPDRYSSEADKAKATVRFQVRLWLCVFACACHDWCVCGLRTAAGWCWV
jgi:hypothetical protein